mmetsp:Transcript_157923/g.291087  ORF Transcript_157923/g.291087 Transcript_157923/m.291087 type:complete len:1101 (-) Transcript_157923:39-3341(-)
MEAAGQVIVDLYRNLEEIRSTLGTSGPEADLVRGAIERAEETLRSKAREIVYAAQGPGAEPAPRTQGRPLASETGLAPHSPAKPPIVPRPTPPGLPPRGEACEVRPRARARSAPRGMRLRAKTTASQRLLPRPNRLDPLADPPALTEGDLEKGLFNLVNRGFIPPAADVTPALERGVPVVLQRPAPLYDKAQRNQKREIATGGDLMASVWLDLRPMEPPQQQMSRSAPQLGMRAPAEGFESPSSPPPVRKALPSTLPALPAPPQHGMGGPFDGAGTFYTELLDASYESPEPFRQALPHAALADRSHHQPMSKDQVRAQAATTLAAFWRGTRSRRSVDSLRMRHSAAYRIQSIWAASKTRAATKAAIQRMREEDRKRHMELMYSMGQDWFHIKQQRRVEIHICSATIPQHRRDTMLSYRPLQASQIGRAFRLLDKKVDVIFVAPKLLHEDILDYYSKIMQYRGVRNPAGRFQVVAPELAGAPENLSLTQALLCSPKALRRLKKLVSGRNAYIVPDIVTHAELKLSSVLDLPLLGAGPRNLALLASKSNAKRLATLAELPVGPWAVDIYDEDEFYASLADLVVRHPEVRHWVFKIDDERGSRGHAYLDLAQLRSITELLRTSQRNARAAAAANAAGAASAPSGLLQSPSQASASVLVAAEPLPSDIEQVQQALRKHLPRKAAICNRRAYPDFNAWMAEASRVGMVVQAVPEGLLSQTSVHLQIDPDGNVSVMGTSEAVCSQPFVRAASWYPHTRGSWDALREVGLRMGKVLAGKGLVGFASVDVAFFENPEFDSQRYAEADREPTPAVIGSDTPVDPQQLMFDGLRSPSPPMSPGGIDEEAEVGAPGGSSAPISLPESRQADYELAMQLQSMAHEARDPISLMLGNRMYASPLSRWACWIVDVDANLTDEAAALFPLQFIAQLRVDQATGDLRLTPEAQAAQAEQAAAVGETPARDEDTDASRRWALVSHTAHTAGMERMSYQSLFQAAKMRGVSFDLFNNVGCVFTFLDVFNSLFSILSIERTAEACAKRLGAAVSAVTDGIGPRDQRGAHAKMSAPRDAPLPVSLDGDPQDGLTVSDVQMALRTLLRQFAERNARRSASR